MCVLRAVRLIDRMSRLVVASLARRTSLRNRCTVETHTVEKHDGNIVPNRSPIPSKAKSRQKFLLIIKEIQKKVRYT